MLEMGARFSNDFYIKVTFDPDQEEGVVTVVYGMGEEITVKDAAFDFDDLG